MHFNSKLDQSTLNLDYSEAEETFIRLIHMDDLDNVVRLNPDLLGEFKETVNCALVNAYRSDENCSRSHLFLQRILYYINRLKLFWFDDLDNYLNENSLCLFKIRSKIEIAWTNWEESQTGVEYSDDLVIDQVLMKRVKEDLLMNIWNQSLIQSSFVTKTELTFASIWTDNTAIIIPFWPVFSCGVSLA